jgi:hypothetical protein
MPRPRYRLVIDGKKRFIFDMNTTSIQIKELTTVGDVKCYFRDIYVRTAIEEHRLKYAKDIDFGEFLPKVDSADVETIDVEVQEYDAAPFTLVRRIKGPSVISQPAVQLMNDSVLNDATTLANANTTPSGAHWGAMRQSAAGCLRAKAERLRREASEFDALAVEAEKLAPNSAAEEAMFRLVNAYRI